MEDLSELVRENSGLLAQQIRLEELLRNDLAVCEEDVKNEDLQKDCDGNVVLPAAVVQAMQEQGRKVAV